MNNYLLTIGFVVCAFLWGGIPTGYIVVKLLRGIDIRNQGSGNIGATNVRRVLGTPWFFGVLILDASKGAVPMILTCLVLDFSDFGQVIIAASVICGNLFSPWLRFKGGKGIGTGLGVLSVLAPFPMLISLVVFVIILLILNYVSIASITTALAFPVLIFAVESIRGIKHNFILLVFSIILAIILIVMHRTNILRFVSGTEHKFFVRDK